MTDLVRAIWVALSVAIAAGACVTVVPGTPGPTGPVVDRAGAQRTVWRNQNIRSYTFAIERQCFCPEEWRGPFDVTVVEGGATLVRFKGGVAVQDRVENLPKTMEALFDLIVANAPTEPDVAYDDRFGFPLRVALDPIKNGIDDEVTYTISNFQVTAPS